MLKGRSLPTSSTSARWDCPQRVRTLSEVRRGTVGKV